MTLNMAATTPNKTTPNGPPKIRKNASKKSKKSWRKNIDMTDVENFLEDQRLEERTGGILSEKTDEDIFTLDTDGADKAEKKSKKREEKPLKCFALLQGLPGANDPKIKRNRLRTKEERMNPVVKRKLKTLVEQGVVSKKLKGSLATRAEYIKQRKENEAERRTRRRTKFDFDLWDEVNASSQETSETRKDGKSDEKPDDSWISTETKTHSAIWTSKHVPKAAKTRKFDTGTLLPAVEVPHPGQSYNPALSDHQDVMWQAALVEITKEKERLKVERQTTGMFPTKNNAPTEASMLQEMAEGIPELGGKDNGDDSGQDDNEDVKADDNDDLEQTMDKGAKPKTRKQRRDMKKRSYKQMQNKLKKKQMLNENEIYRLKSMKKELKNQEEITKQRQKKKEEEKIEAKKNPTALSKYKYQAPEIEVKLTEELTGNLRNLKPEGSLLEDRYKSLQRRNIIETRVVHRQAKGKKKIVNKRSHNMGWEKEQSARINRKRQMLRSRQQKKALQKKK